MRENTLVNWIVGAFTVLGILTIFRSLLTEFFGSLDATMELVLKFHKHAKRFHAAIKNGKVVGEPTRKV